MGEIASDIPVKAAEATDDLEMQVKLGLKAFLKAVPEGILAGLETEAFRKSQAGFRGGQVLTESAGGGICKRTGSLHHC